MRYRRLESDAKVLLVIVGAFALAMLVLVGATYVH